MSKVKYTIYDSSTGEIRYTGSMREDDDLSFVPLGMSLIVSDSNQKSQYIDIATEEVKDKEEMPAVISSTAIIANGIDQAVISGIDALQGYVELYIDRAFIDRYVATSLEITFDSAGEYSIILKGAKYIDKEFIINAS